MLETEAVLKAVRNLDRGTLQPKIEIWLSSQYFFVKPNFACINSTFKMAYLHSTLASAPAPAYPFGRLRAR